MPPAAVQARDVEVTFEAYVRKDGRWWIVDVVRDRDSALRLGHRLKEQKEHDAVRIVRDELDTRTGETVEIVIFDSEIKRMPPPPPRPKPPAPKPRPEVEPAARPRPAAGAKSSLPWLALTSGVLGMVFAVLGFWFIGAIR